MLPPHSVAYPALVGIEVIHVSTIKVGHHDLTLVIETVCYMGW
jgi:hypothetical protein